MKKIVKIVLLFVSVCYINTVKSQVNAPLDPTIQKPLLELPKGYSSTVITINPNAPADIKKQFYAKSQGKNSYTIFRDEKGIEVTEQELKARVILENKQQLNTPSFK